MVEPPFLSGCNLGRLGGAPFSQRELIEKNGSEGPHVTNNAIVHQTNYQKHANTRRIQRLQEGRDRPKGFRWRSTPKNVSEIILVHRFDRIDLARIFVYTYILHIYIIPKKNNKKLKKNLCFLLVIYVFCFLYVKK